MHNVPSASLTASLTGFAKLLAGFGVRWVGCRPDARQRIYIANHTSHRACFVTTHAPPPAARARTRPVAARDYWMANGLRRFLARRIFRVVFVERRHDAVRHGSPLAPLLGALADRQNSLILFPEGTRGTGPDAGPFKSGLYYLAKERPDVELVPAFIEHPGGRAGGGFLPGGLSFGAPLQLGPDEEKFDFLSRARAAVNGLRTA